MKTIKRPRVLLADDFPRISTSRHYDAPAARGRGFSRAALRRRMRTDLLLAIPALWCVFVGAIAVGLFIAGVLQIIRHSHESRPDERVLFR
jgi:hypothetical protein